MSRSPAFPPPALAVDSLAFGLHVAAQVMAAVFAGESLAGGRLGQVPTAARPAVQEMVYGALRDYGRGDGLLGQLLQTPVAAPEVRALLLVAFYRLDSWPQSPHTVVDQAVQAAGLVAGGRFKGLVNGVLRNYLRRQTALEETLRMDPVARWKHPTWWLARLQKAYPQNWQEIALAGNGLPPMALRVNERRMAAAQYLARLEEAGLTGRCWGEAGILLDRPAAVDRLPGFDQGWASVQDPGAQRAALWLDPPPGSRVLDACAAPGGKTAHLLERNGPLELLALDLKTGRCRRIEENLSRLGLTATVRVADAAAVETWWDGRFFDAILLDAPCTASGVVRRHPDAKWLRRAKDVGSFARAQGRLLDALWRVLAPGGKLLYATCSLFPEENGEQVLTFERRTAGVRRCREEQLLPNADHDGFYYCLLEKTA